MSGLKRLLVLVAIVLPVGAIVLVLLAVFASYRVAERAAALTFTTQVADPSAAADEGVHPGMLYGRVTTDGGVTYEGRLR